MLVDNDQTLLQVFKTKPTPMLSLMNLQSKSVTMISCNSDCLKIVTYNCRGWNSGSNYVKSLLHSIYIRLIQEHWLLCENLQSLVISSDFLSVGVSGMDSSQLVTGRPCGGCSILHRKPLSPLVQRIFTHSKRLCAILITLNNSCEKSPFVLLICVYLPTDYFYWCFSSGFSESLCELSVEKFDNNIIASNFNVDFLHSGRNCSNLYMFMQWNNLVCVDQKF